jgi:hypothetical protein
MAAARGLGLWGFEGRAFGGARKSAGVVGVVGHVRGDLRGRIEGGSPGDGSTENRFGCGGRRGRERKHAAAIEDLEALMHRTVAGARTRGALIWARAETY